MLRATESDAKRRSLRTRVVSVPYCVMGESQTGTARRECVQLRRPVTGRQQLFLMSKGAFTPDANEALRTNDLLVKSMQRRDRQSCGAIRANGVNSTARIERLEHLTRESHELKNLNFGGYSRRVNQSGACSSSDVITSGGRKSQTTMEDKLMVVVCGYPELYDTTSYFYKNRNKFSNETGAACRSPSHDANSRLLCSEFHARMK